MRRAYAVYDTGAHFDAQHPEVSLEDKILNSQTIQQVRLNPAAVIVFRDPYATTRRIIHKCARYTRILLTVFALAILILYVMLFSYVLENADSYIASQLRIIGDIFMRLGLLYGLGISTPVDPDLQTGGNVQASLLPPRAEGVRA